MSRKLLPKKALEVLGQAQWDKEATRDLEWLSLSLFWSDELVMEAGMSCMERDPEDVSFKDLLFYRTSLIRGTPDERYRPVWDQVLEAYPHWPGFRDDRCSPDLSAALDSAIRRVSASVEREAREHDSTET